MPETPSHLDSRGNAHMVDVGDKQPTRRSAVASVTVLLVRKAFEQAKTNAGAKGAVLTVAKVAGIQAAKKTAELIPLCHQLPLESVDIEFDLNEPNHSIHVRAKVSTHSRTGVEMEALTACSVAALTIYDMLKAIQKDIVISDLKLLRKTGGLSGDYIAD